MGICKTDFRPPLNFSASVTHAHCILGSSRKIHIDQEDVHLQFAELELFYQIVKMHEFLNRQEGQRRQRQTEPVVLDTIKKCGDH